MESDNYSIEFGSNLKLQTPQGKLFFSTRYPDGALLISFWEEDENGSLISVDAPIVDMLENYPVQQRAIALLNPRRVMT